ncbi:hypothetical protein [Paenirhodobacter populi]|uniref:Uncharacterized protein n=1 Tax=Paenirhodobacter populi TaxID=2306993 RepID=A0A443JGM8_9RHOB|nr:hypothetical protein [Sinirhodobacter populi]RWR19573.1 hypothetical protein D2T30_13765 [Sinirhodobacter populi]
MEEVSIIGVDLARQVFQLHGATAEGEVASSPSAPSPCQRRPSSPRCHRQMRFSPEQCGALREIECGVATRSVADIEKIGAATEADQHADPAEVARLSARPVPTVPTIGNLNQQDAMAFSLVFGSMLRHIIPTS